jgi:hypothetical protein
MSTILLSGILFVESRVLDGCVKKKHVQLVSSSSPSSSFVSQGGESQGLAIRISSMHSSKRDDWSLDSSTVVKVDDPAERMFQEQESKGLLSHVVHTSRLHQVKLFSMTVSLSGVPWKTRCVRLCFESMEELHRWKKTLEDAVYTVACESSMGRVVTTMSEYEGKENLWDTFMHVNGISMYRESGDHTVDGHAVMSSVVIRSTPHLCLKSLLSSGYEESKVGGTLAFSDSVEILKHIDKFSSIVRIRWSCSNMLGYVFFPREAVLLRTWRKDEDGTYVIVYQAVEDEYTSMGSNAVGAKIIAAGFTIAPLREEYYDTCECRSPESLVTLVVKADLGGILSNSGVLSSYFPSLHRYLCMKLIQPLLMSLVLMRDRLEQSRFVVMPSMFSQDEEDVHVDEDHLERWIDVSASSSGLTPTKVPISTEVPLSVFGIHGSCDKRYWSYPGYDYLKIRGKTYLEDKIKVPAESPVFELYSSDLINSEEVLFHVAANLPSVQYCDAPYAFVLNLVFPNNPLQSLVTVWTCPIDPTEHTVDELVEKWHDKDPDGSLRGFFKNYKDWIQGDEQMDDERRNKKFKLIPRIAKGSWVVRQSVGKTPVLLGQKLDSKYFRGRTSRGCSYFEMDVDITSNSVANNVTRLVVNSITSLVVDLSPLIEGQAEDELPERLIGSVRYNHLDLRTAATWDNETRSIRENTSI